MQRKPFYDLPGPTEPGLNLLEYTENILQLCNPDSHHCERCGKRIWSSGKVSSYSRGFIWSCNGKPRTLAAFDVFLDLSWEEGNSRMSIFISDESLEKGAAQCAEQSQSAQNDEPDPEPVPVPVPYTPVKLRGRPTTKPINDVSPGHVFHMRFMEVPAETIAEEIGVFRRTLFPEACGYQCKGHQSGYPIQPVELLKIHSVPKFRDLWHTSHFWHSHRPFC